MNLRWYLSGGRDNHLPDGSLGGERSDTEVGSLLNNLFPDVSSREASEGSVLHRCVYLLNDDPAPAGLLDPIRAWLLGLPEAAGQQMAIAVPGFKGDVTLAADEELGLPDLRYASPLSKDGGIRCPAPLLRGDYFALWVRRMVQPGAHTDVLVRWRIAVEGDIIPAGKEKA